MLAPSLLDVVQRMLLIVGGKFRGLGVNHENNKNWHPTKITSYTVSFWSKYACVIKQGCVYMFQSLDHFDLKELCHEEAASQYYISML